MPLGGVFFPASPAKRMGAAELNDVLIVRALGGGLEPWLSAGWKKIDSMIPEPRPYATPDPGQNPHHRVDRQERKPGEDPRAQDRDGINGAQAQ